MKFFILSIYLLLTPFVQGQIYFEKTFDIDSAGDLSSSIILTSNGYFVSGEGSVNGDWHIENRVIDFIGNEINTSRIGDTNNLYADGGSDVVIKSNGFYYWGGGMKIMILVLNILLLLKLNYQEIQFG